MRKVYVIAEAGVNHNGSAETAEKLIKIAAEAGADAVKFQTYRTELLVSADAPKADYQKETTSKTESQYEMLRKLELPREAYPHLMSVAKATGIDFLSTPFEKDSLNFLIEDCGLALIKLPSGEITNGPFLLAAARTGRKIILSAGMSNLSEIETALGVLAFGYLEQGEPTSRRDFARAYVEAQTQGLLAQKVTLLHCTTEYPAPFDEVNLNAMDTLRRAFMLPVGYSDHTPGTAVALAAAALGAEVIEKHFTADRNLPGPDHAASLEPTELGEMVRGIRQIERALGDSRKMPRLREQNNINAARKSLTAARSIRRGEPFTAENLCAKRPGFGRSPMEYWELLGQKAAKDYAADEPI